MGMMSSASLAVHDDCRAAIYGSSDLFNLRTLFLFDKVGLLLSRQTTEGGCGETSFTARRAVLSTVLVLPPFFIHTVHA